MNLENRESYPPYSVWGFHPESDSKWEERGGFQTIQEAKNYMMSLDEVDNGMGWYDILDSKGESVYDNKV